MVATQDNRDVLERKNDARLAWQNTVLRSVLGASALVAIGFIYFIYNAYFDAFEVIGSSNGGSSGSSNHIADNKAFYGQFGDFFGGTLNPILSFMSFIAILFTISLQITELRQNSKELREARKVAEQQKEHFENEARKSEILQAIKQFENEYEGIINFEPVPDYGNSTIGKQVEKLYEAAKIGVPLPTYDDSSEKSLTLSIFRRGASVISEIDNLVCEYSKLSHYKDSPPLAKFYKSKYYKHALVFSRWKAIGSYNFSSLV